MILVHPIDKIFKIEIGEGDQKITFSFSQLTYKHKNIVSNQSSRIEKGELLVDYGLQCFLTLKFSLKDVEGIFTLDDKGNEIPYKLDFDSDGIVKDDCLDSLLNSEVMDPLIYTAKDLLSGIPKEIRNPLTGEKVEGIEVIPPSYISKKK